MLKRVYLTLVMLQVNCSLQMQKLYQVYGCQVLNKTTHVPHSAQTQIQEDSSEAQTVPKDKPTLLA